MTLLITVIAAIIATAVWYAHAPQSQMRVGMLAWMYWGAAIMWFVDAIFEYVEDPKGYFNPQPVEMLNDTYLGLSVLALGGIIWIVTLLVTDPRGVVAKTMNALIETKLAKNTTSADQTPAAVPQA